MPSDYEEGDVMSGNKFGNDKFGEGWERPTHEEEYLRSKREEAFNILEKKIGAETIDLRNKTYAEAGEMDMIAKIESHDEDKKDDVCTYPECNCPFDMGADNKCLIGKKQRYATREQKSWYLNYVGDDAIIKAWRNRNG